ncbi:MAG: hypothetical protein WCP19_16215 [Chloroflexota bacterium]
MYRGTPVTNFNGAVLVDSLEVGSIIVSNQNIPAVRITIRQMVSYPVLAHGSVAGEIYAFCFMAHENGDFKLEAYTPCYLIADQNGALVPVIASVTWYVSSALREKSADQILNVLNGKTLGDGSYPSFRQTPFADFSALASVMSR